MSRASPATSEPPLKRRHPHRKSRTGCFGCRSRRVKCDEHRPICRSCSRRETSCDYPVDTPAEKGGSLRPSEPRSRHPNHGSPKSTTSTFTGSASSSRAHSQLPSEALCLAHYPAASDEVRTEFDIGDLALMHHWTLSIPAATCRAPDQIHIWQHLFPRIGFEHPFVNSAILGSAALHLAHLSPPGPAREAYVTRATLHHNAGLNGFQRSIVTISPSNSEALFVWSILNILYIFGISTYNLAGVLSRKDLVLGVEWIPMLKGISAVLKPIYSDLLVGRMMSIVNIGNFSDLDPGPLATQGVDGLLCNIRDTWKHLSNAPIYDECLCSLRRCRMFMDQFDNMGPAALAESGYHRAWSGPFIFIFVVPEAYFTLLHQRQPPALVLFAFYGALMHMVRDFWFIGGLGKEIVEVVDDLIGPYWRPYITWPLEFVDSAQ